MFSRMIGSSNGNRLTRHRLNDSRTVVQPLCDVVDYPVEALEEVLASHGAARPYAPVVRSDGLEVESVADLGLGH